VGREGFEPPTPCASCTHPTIHPIQPRPSRRRPGRPVHDPEARRKPESRQLASLSNRGRAGGRRCRVRHVLVRTAVRTKRLGKMVRAGLLRSVPVGRFVGCRQVTGQIRAGSGSAGEWGLGVGPNWGSRGRRFESSQPDQKPCSERVRGGGLGLRENLVRTIRFWSGGRADQRCADGARGWLVLAVNRQATSAERPRW
jgi:hypothetical protein